MMRYAKQLMPGRNRWSDSWRAAGDQRCITKGTKETLRIERAQSRDVETSPKGLCRKTGYRCKEGEKQSRACEKIAASVVLVAQRTAVWISTRAIWVRIILFFLCEKHVHSEHVFNWFVTGIFFNFRTCYCFLPFIFNAYADQTLKKAIKHPITVVFMILCKDWIERRIS